MWNAPTQKQLEALPKLYSTEKVPTEQKIIHMHFFMGGSDWWIAECDSKQGLLFGFACLGGDWQDAEWGYTSLDELKQVRAGAIEVDRDLHWKPKPFGEVRKELEV